MTDEVTRRVAEVAAWYDQTAERFTERYTGINGEFWRRFEEEPALRLLPPRTHMLLDLGCGPGRLANALTSRAEQVVGVDVSPSMIAIARARPHAENVRYAVADATTLAFADASFDVVMSIGMFEYLDDPRPFLNEIARVLRPGGIVVFTCFLRVSPIIRLLIFAETVLRSIARRIVTSKPAQRPSPVGGDTFRKAQHDRRSIFTTIIKAGFDTPDYKGFHFPLTVSAFHLASGIRWTRARDAAKSSAVAADQRLGASTLTRSWSSVAMFTARKVASSPPGQRSAT